MSRTAALLYIVRDAKRDMNSKTSYQRMRRALRMLGLTEHEMNEVLLFLGYHHPDTHQPYPRFV